jgi:hypothetical protein
VGFLSFCDLEEDFTIQANCTDQVLAHLVFIIDMLAHLNSCINKFGLVLFSWDWDDKEIHVGSAENVRGNSGKLIKNQNKHSIREWVNVVK